MERIAWNDDKTNKGLEGWYGVDPEKKLIVVYIKPTNSLEDWITNFKARGVKMAGVRCHRGYLPYAKWLCSFIVQIMVEHDILSPEKVIVIGYSMGGGVAQEYGIRSMLPVRIYNIGGPRVCSLPFDWTTYWMRGDIVPWIPFWFKKTKTIKKLGVKWHPFWKAHAAYPVSELIKEILEKESA